MESLSLQTLIALLLATLAPPFLISWLILFWVRRAAPRLGLIDQPGERKVHVTPTPLGGGIGIWAGVVGTFAVATTFLWLSGMASFVDSLPEVIRTHRAGMLSKLDSLWLLLAAGSVLAILGLMDDRKGLDWRIRLAVQFGIAALCVAWQGWRITAFINIPLLTGAMSVIWIVALINSFNMLDNMDGLSGGVATIAASSLALVMFLNGDPDSGAPQLFVGAFLLVVVGALLGFLMHNFPPARIFMGDAGSYFVGFCIAVATLLATYTGYNSDKPHALLAPLFVMAVPLYDMTTVILIRLKRGKSPFEADKNHFSHRLTELGLTKTQAVLTIYLLTATCGLAAILLHQVNWIGALIIALMIACVLALIAILETSARVKLQS